MTRIPFLPWYRAPSPGVPAGRPTSVRRLAMAAPYTRNGSKFPEMPKPGREASLRCCIVLIRGTRRLGVAVLSFKFPGLVPPGF